MVVRRRANANTPDERSICGSAAGATCHRRDRKERRALENERDGFGRLRCECDHECYDCDCEDCWRSHRCVRRATFAPDRSRRGFGRDCGRDAIRVFLLAAFSLGVAVA